MKSSLTRVVKSIQRQQKVQKNGHPVILCINSLTFSTSMNTNLEKVEITNIGSTNFWVFQLSGLLRHELMDFMFSDPTMLDDLDYLFKSDVARKLLFYYQVMHINAVQSASPATPKPFFCLTVLKYLFLPIF